MRLPSQASEAINSHKLIAGGRSNSYIVKIQTTYLFVYGTLRRNLVSPVLETISEHIDWVANARVKGALYDIGNYPGAVPVDSGIYITGEVIEIKEPGSVLQLLDDYEGYDPGNEIRSEYCRKKEWVEFEDGTGVEAWIYWYNFPVNEKQRIPGNDYLKYLEKK